MTNADVFENYLDNLQKSNPGSLDYSDFVLSKTFESYLEKLHDLNPSVAEAIGEHGFGENLCDDGSYDYESGEMIADLPEEIKDIIYEDDEIYDLICEMADAYAVFCKGE